MAAKTRLLLDGYGGRRAGSFAGKTGAVSHATDGALQAQAATVTGAAACSGVAPGPHGESAYDKPYRVLHSTSGRLVAQSAVVRGTAEVTRTGQNTLALLLIAA